LNILIIDTATAIEIVAAAARENIADRTKKVETSHSVTLFENIDLALKGISTDIKDINLIGTGIGPGSFTGIRIAVTTARMFAQIFGLPIVGMKTHLMYAYSAVEQAETDDYILIAFDAKKSRVFGALYKKDKNGNPVELIQPGDYEIEFLINKINYNKTILIGDGCEKYYDQLKTGLSKYDLLPEYKPSGKIICGRVEKLYRENPDQYNDYNKVLPFYSRKTDAEIMKESRKISQK
jgi:tRNA threonylcarbamoyladenosine biosynthesis protein TsaB